MPPPPNFTHITRREGGLHHTLSSGQISMIAIGGAIGTGLFLGSAFAIGFAGPSVLLSYTVGALIALLLMGCLAEMTVAHPTSGSFGAYAEVYLSPLAGFLVRYAYWSAVVLAVGTEVTAIAVYMRLWYPSVPGTVWILGFSAALIAVNAANVKVFGSVEYGFSLFKILAIAAFILVGGYVILAAPASSGIGLANFRSHGGLFPHGLWGTWVAVIVAIFSYFSVEMVAVAAAEARDPQRAITRAFRATVLRLIFIYLLSLAVMLAIVPWDMAGNTARNQPAAQPAAQSSAQSGAQSSDQAGAQSSAQSGAQSSDQAGAQSSDQAGAQSSAQTGTSSSAQSGPEAALTSSPFVKVAAFTHLPYAAGILNLVVLIAALSAMNSQIYITTRMMFSLSRAGFAPRRFGALNRRGVPLPALLLSTLGIALATVLNLLFPATAFTLMMSVSMFGAIFTWLMIFVTHLRFRRAHASTPLAFRMPGAPYTTFTGIALLSALLLTTPFTPAFRLTLVYGLPFLATLTAIFLVRYRHPESSTLEAPASSRNIST